MRANRSGPPAGRDDSPVGERDGRDLPRPEAVNRGLFRQVLAAHGEFVHFLPADVLDQGEVLRGLSHRQVHIRQQAVVTRVGP